MSAPPSMTVFIPLTLRKRNGRPKILPPADTLPATKARNDPHVLRAIARAWSWRRKLESGKASTLLDIAEAENVTDRFVSRMVRLAYLAPSVLQKLVLEHRPISVSIKELIAAAELPWEAQEAAVFN